MPGLQQDPLWGALWGGHVLQEEGDHAQEGKYPLLSRENLQGKSPEVRTSWAVFFSFLILFIDFRERK